MPRRSGAKVTLVWEWPSYVLGAATVNDRLDPVFGRRWDQILAAGTREQIAFLGRLRS